MSNYNLRNGRRECQEPAKSRIDTEHEAQTAALRPQFAAISDALSGLDSLILHFAGAAAGNALIAAHQNARNVIDRGLRSASAPEAPAGDSGARKQSCIKA